MILEENTLIACFRVAEDSTYSDAQDELFTLPAGNIGIPHVLEIPRICRCIQANLR